MSLYDATPPGEVVPGHKLPRLHPDGIAPTLRAGSDSSHGSYTAPRPIHPSLPRCITSREAARLHGYPDWFSFYPLKWHAYRQIGNSVCPPIARAIGRKIIDAIGVSTTNQPPEPIELPDQFTLPEDRPRTLKRIPVIREFPPVINHLFYRAYDEAKKEVTKPQFTFADVQEAIAETGVNLHWVRKDTFLPEIARSRRSGDILSVPHQHGFTIKHLENQNAIGEFIPLGSNTGLEDKDSIYIRIEEIHNAKKLDLDLCVNGEAQAYLPLFCSPQVLAMLWNSKTAAIDYQQSTEINGNLVLNVKKSARSKSHRVAVVIAKPSSLPTRNRLCRVAKEHDCGELVLVVNATTKHLVAIRYTDCKSSPIEKTRVAFESLAGD